MSISDELFYNILNICGLEYLLHVDFKRSFVYSQDTCKSYLLLILGPFINGNEIKFAPPIFFLELYIEFDRNCCIVYSNLHILNINICLPNCFLFSLYFGNIITYTSKYHLKKIAVALRMTIIFTTPNILILLPTANSKYMHSFLEYYYLQIRCVQTDKIESKPRRRKSACGIYKIFRLIINSVL